MLMKTRGYIDFHVVEGKHADIHKRLLNWARWVNGRAGSATSPMFRMCVASARARSHDGACGQLAGVVDGADAGRLAKAVALLPACHRAAVNWSYVKPVAPHAAAASMGTSLQGLATFLRDGRQMLVSRGV